MRFRFPFIRTIGDETQCCAGAKHFTFWIRLPLNLMPSTDCTTHLCAAHTLLLQFAAGFGSFFRNSKPQNPKTVSQVWPMFARFCWMVCNWHWWHLRCLTGRAGRRLVGVDWWSAICWDVAPGGGSWTVRVPEMRLDSLQPEACVSGGGFKDLFFFSPNPVEMIQFVLFIIFFKWVESWNHQLAKDVFENIYCTNLEDYGKKELKHATYQDTVAIISMFCFEQEDWPIEILLPSPRVWFWWKITDRKQPWGQRSPSGIWTHSNFEGSMNSRCGRFHATFM